MKNTQKIYCYMTNKDNLKNKILIRYKSCISSFRPSLLLMVLQKMVNQKQFYNDHINVLFRTPDNTHFIYTNKIKAFLRNVVKKTISAQLNHITAFIAVHWYTSILIFIFMNSDSN